MPSSMCIVFSICIKFGFTTIRILEQENTITSKTSYSILTLEGNAFGYESPYHGMGRTMETETID